jgi:predicted acyl esterase
MAVLDPGGKDTLNRAEKEFPLKRTLYQKLFLNAKGGTLEAQLPKMETSVAYVSDDESGHSDFQIRFARDVELSGYMKTKLWVEARDSDDMDLFVYADKLDKDGKSLPIIIKGAPYSGKTGEPYEWGNGWLRVSHRKLDAKKSTEAIPYLTQNEEQKLSRAEIVSVEIELGVMGMRFHQDEQLRLTVTGYERAAREFPELPRTKTLNRGYHVIHTGRKYDSYLQVPVIE